MAGKGTKMESENTKPHEHVTFKIKTSQEGKRDRKNPEKEILSNMKAKPESKITP